MTSSTTHPIEYVWNPSRDEYLSLMWTLFPDQAGSQRPEFIDIFAPDDLTETVSVSIDPSLLDKLFCLSVVSSLTLSEVIRRLLEGEMQQYGDFAAIDTIRH